MSEDPYSRRDCENGTGSITDRFKNLAHTDFYLKIKEARYYSLRPRWLLINTYNSKSIIFSLMKAVHFEALTVLIVLL